MPKLNFDDGVIPPTTAELTPSDLFAQSGLCRSSDAFVTKDPGMPTSLLVSYASEPPTRVTAKAVSLLGKT